MHRGKKQEISQNKLGKLVGLLPIWFHKQEPPSLIQQERESVWKFIYPFK